MSQTVGLVNRTMKPDLRRAQRFGLESENKESFYPNC